MGYTFEAKIDKQFESEFFEYVENLFGQQAKLAENFSNRFVYNVPRDSIKSLGFVFEKLEKGIQSLIKWLKEFILNLKFIFKAKKDGLIVEYNFSQCTLEQVFIQFAKQQET